MSTRYALKAAALWVCVWVILMPPAGWSEESLLEFFPKSWLADDGLPTTTANDVVLDHDGFLWVATVGGLARFDGVYFKSFTSPLISGQSAKNIRALATTADGTLLTLPAVGGVVQLKQGQFSPHPAGVGLVGDQLRDIFVGRDDSIWLEIAGGRLRHWSRGHSEEFTAADGLSERNRASFAEDRAGNMWVASGSFIGRYLAGKFQAVTTGSREVAFVASSSSGGVWVCKGARLYRIEQEQVVTVATNLPWNVVGEVVRAMFEDRQGVLWIGTGAYGLYCFANGGFSRVENVHSQITAITDDAEGNLWVTSQGGGLTRVRPKLFQLYNAAAGLLEDVSDSVSADARGNVWVGNRSSGVARIAGGKAEAIQFPEGTRKFRAYAVCADDGGNIWGSEGGIFRFSAEPPHVVQRGTNNPLEIHVLFKSRQGDLWIGGESGLLGRYVGGQIEAFEMAAGFPGRQIRSLAEDSAGRIWIGTENSGLFCWAAGKFTAFGTNDGLPEVPIRALYADAAGVLWIGTIGSGLWLAQSNRFTGISIASGLADDNIAAIVEDAHGRLWLGSRSGIFHVAKSDLLNFANGASSAVNAVKFGRSEGLAGISCLGSVQPMACRTPDGRVWFATQQGVLSLDAASFNPNPQPPPIFIDEVLVNDRPLNVAGPLRVPPLCRKMEFRFAALSYTAPERVRLRYRLEGVDSDWVETVGRREAVYTGLQPGRYRLRVKACNSAGVWNETGAALAFTVLPTWWQSWWFRAAALMVSLTGLTLAVRYWSQRRLKLKLERLEQQQALERERMRIARDLHDDLGATVTQVGLMVEELSHTPPAAEEFKAHSVAVSSRVRMLARDLDAVVWSVNPSNDSWSQLASYLSQFFLESLRRSVIRPRLEISEGIPNDALPPEIRHHLFLVVKEAINNVIKHSHATEATLGICVTAGVFEVLIQDNGCGFDPEAIARLPRNGLRNMRARAAEMGCTFEVSSRPGAGTLIRIGIALNPSTRRHH